jgi:Trk K+ transport system NAD-binding subunit
MQPGLRVVLRLFDDDFARRVEDAFQIPISRSVSRLAAPAFAAALLEREVVGTIAVERRVLVLAELPVAEGSSLDGRPVADVSETGAVRVIAHTVGAARPGWLPSPAARIRAGDRLLVIATRAGLASALSGAGAVRESGP